MRDSPVGEGRVTWLQPALAARRGRNAPCHFRLTAYGQALDRKKSCPLRSNHVFWNGEYTRISGLVVEHIAAIGVTRVRSPAAAKSHDLVGVASLGLLWVLPRLAEEDPRNANERSAELTPQKDQSLT